MSRTEKIIIQLVLWSLAVAAIVVASWPKLN